MAILQKEVGDVEKERLLKEHEKSISKFQMKMKEEQDRTKEMLRKKLEERRKKKLSAGMSKIREEFEEETKEAIQDEREKLSALQKEGAKMLTSATKMLEVPTIKGTSSYFDLIIIFFFFFVGFSLGFFLFLDIDIQNSVADTSELLNTIPASLNLPLSNEQEWLNKLADSPIFRDVNDIENIIRKKPQKESLLDEAIPYVDIKVGAYNYIL